MIWIGEEELKGGFVKVKVFNIFFIFLYNKNIKCTYTKIEEIV